MYSNLDCINMGAPCPSYAPTFSCVTAPSLTQMDRLPVELLEHIFRLACIDGGMTGCALASVSRSIRRASSQMRYYSVSLRGAKQIRAFISLLDRNEAGKSPANIKKGHRIRFRPVSRRMSLTTPIVLVRNLFLADCQSAGAVYQWKRALVEWSVDPTTDRLSRFVQQIRYIHKFERSSWKWGTTGKSQTIAETRAETTIHDVLARLAPSLERLCIDQEMRSPLFHSPVFPALVELTCRLQRDLEESTKLSFLCTQFPALQYLHFVNEQLYRPPFALSDEQGLPLPLKHVRFSGVWNPVNLLSNLAPPGKSPWARKGVPNILISRQPRSGFILSPVISMSAKSITPLNDHVEPPSDTLTIVSDVSPVLPDVDIRTLSDVSSMPHDVSPVVPDIDLRTLSDVSSRSSHVLPIPPDQHAMMMVDLPPIPTPPPSMYGYWICGTGAPSMSLVPDLSEWRKAASTNEDITSQIFVVDDPHDYDVYRLHREWLARMQGQEGCWKDGVPLALADL
jgi:hypothetical protein